MLQDYRFSKLILILSGPPARYRPRMRGDVDTFWPAQERRSTKSRTLRVFEQVRAEILDGRLRPGARLHLTTLSGRFAVSLGAVREALSRLVAAGLVPALPRRAVRGSPVSVGDYPTPPS